MKILLTAFDPFGGEPVNPAQKAVEAVSDVVAGAEVVKCIVPTVFGKSIETVYEAMKREKPDVTFCIGQAGGRVGLTPERVAINLNDARIPDNEGQQPLDTKIFEDGENAYFASLPDGGEDQRGRHSCKRFLHSRYICLQPPDVWSSLLH